MRIKNVQGSQVSALKHKIKSLQIENTILSGKNQEYKSTIAVMENYIKELETINAQNEEQYSLEILKYAEAVREYEETKQRLLHIEEDYQEKINTLLNRLKRG